MIVLIIAVLIVPTLLLKVYLIACSVMLHLYYSGIIQFYSEVTGHFLTFFFFNFGFRSFSKNI